MDLSNGSNYFGLSPLAELSEQRLAEVTGLKKNESFCVCCIMVGYTARKTEKEPSRPKIRVAG